MDVTLQVIREPAIALVRTDAPPRPRLVGDGDVDLRCGRCAAVVASGMPAPTSLRGFVTTCQACAAVNRAS